MDKIKEEAKRIGISALMVLIMFKAVFYSESLISIVKITMLFYWLFALPGFMIMCYWKEKIDFIERLVIGTLLGAGIFGMTSYYFGLLGVHVKYMIIIAPALTIIAGSFLSRKEFI